MPKHILHNYLQRYRKAWGLTQPELGLLLGVGKSAISKYENEVCAVPTMRLLAFEIVFGVPGTELLPAERDAVEDQLARGALALHNRLDGNTDAASVKKLVLLNAIKDRLHEATDEV